MTFSISWSTPSGRFGWTEITECVDIEAAIAHFTYNVRGVDVPADAEINAVRKV